MEAYACWCDRFGYFARVGDKFYRRNGDEIDPLELTYCDRPIYRQGMDLGDVQDEYHACVLLNEAYPNVGYTLIHLADNEWGNTIMWQVAKEHFDANPACQFIEVYEHAGWFLCYRRDGSCWGTANDTAILRKIHPRPAHGVERVIRRGPQGSDHWLCKHAEARHSIKVAA